MYQPEIVERLLREQQKNGSDLAEYCFNDRRHTVRHLVKEGANPTAELVEKVADYLNVPIDVIFGRKEQVSDLERVHEATKKLVESLEGQLQTKDNEIALLRNKIKTMQVTLTSIKKFCEVESEK